MPSSPITRQRVISKDTCILGFTGNQYVKSYVFDATTLTADSNGFFYIPAFSFVTKSPANPTLIKVYQALGTNVDAVQTITVSGTPTGGTFTLTYSGDTTAAIPYNATAGQVATALNALGNVGAGGVTCSGGPFPGTAVIVTFGGSLANAPQPTMTATSSLTGGTSPAVTVASTTAGQTAETIIGVFDNLAYDLFGNSVANDEPVAIYDQFTAFDTTKLQNWAQYAAAAKAALPLCSFQP